MRRDLAPVAWDENVPKLALVIGFGEDIPPFPYPTPLDNQPHGTIRFVPSVLDSTGAHACTS